MYHYNVALFREDSELKFYIIGLILADGYISGASNRIELAFKESDKGFLEGIRNIICPGKPLKYKQKQKAYRVTLDNADIYKEVMKYVNSLPKTTKLLFPYGIPDRYLPHFIRGYSDGDGNISVKYGRRKLKDGSFAKYYGLRFRILGTRQFLMGVECNLRRIDVSKNEVHPHKKGQENVFYIEYGFSQAKAVLDFIYKDATFMLPRKYQVYMKISNADSDELERVYGTPEGHYNTLECK